jgi:hypothetical protein
MQVTGAQISCMSSGLEIRMECLAALKLKKGRQRRIARPAGLWPITTLVDLPEKSKILLRRSGKFTAKGRRWPAIAPPSI